MTDLDTVYVAANSRRSSSAKTYHTDADCRMLAQANGYRTVDFETLFDDMPVCSYCDGTWNGGRPPTGGASSDRAESRSCRKCGAERDVDGTCPFCDACDGIGVTNGRTKAHRRARREALDD